MADGPFTKIAEQVQFDWLTVEAPKRKRGERCCVHAVERAIQLAVDKTAEEMGLVDEPNRRRFLYQQVRHLMLAELLKERAGEREK